MFLSSCYECDDFDTKPVSFVVLKSDLYIWMSCELFFSFEF